MARVTTKWSREELILCLNLYLRLGARIASDHPAVVELSGLLRRMPRSSADSSDGRYRSPDAVHLKLQNFLAIDPANRLTAMPHGAAGDPAVFSEFASRPADLARLARLIESAISDGESVDARDADDDAEFPEGRILYSLHRRYERDRRLVRRAHKRHLDRHGRLFCEACSFDFSVTYGARGEGYIEVHHDMAVSELTPGGRTRLSDLKLLCSNCHRIIHRRRPWLVVDDLRRLLEETKRNPVRPRAPS